MFTRDDILLKLYDAYNILIEDEKIILDLCQELTDSPSFIFNQNTSLQIELKNIYDYEKKYDYNIDNLKYILDMMILYSGLHKAISKCYIDETNYYDKNRLVDVFMMNLIFKFIIKHDFLFRYNELLYDEDKELNEIINFSQEDVVLQLCDRDSFNELNDSIEVYDTLKDEDKISFNNKLQSYIDLYCYSYNMMKSSQELHYKIKSRRINEIVDIRNSYTYIFVISILNLPISFFASIMAK